MSQCETKAWGKCGHCGGGVAVKTNRSGLAYYRCDHCGAHMQHHWQKTSDKLLAEIGYKAHTEPAPADEKPAAPAKVKAAPKSAPGSVAALLGIGG